MTTPSDMHLLDLSRSPGQLARVFRHAHEIPDSPAITYDGGALTWAQTLDLVLRLARDLRDRGVRTGDRVALLTTNRPEFLLTVLATWALGAITVPVNFRLTPREVAFVLDNTTPAVLLVEDRTAELATGAGEHAATAAPEVLDLDSRAYLDPATFASGPLDVLDVVVPAAADDCAIMHTSGTTGNPKGAVLSHLNVFVCSAGVAKKWEVSSGKGVVMLAPPLFHIGTFLASQGAIAGGGTALVVASSGFDAAATLRTMKEHAVTAAFMVPQQWSLLCEEIDRAGGADAVGLQLGHANWGGAPASAKVLDHMRAAMPHTEVKASFGQTETSGYGVGIDWEDSLRKPGSVGKPADDMEVRVVDPEMNDVAPGEIGEIVYRGPGVMSRFWNNPEATAEAFAGGWFHSGDLVRRDEEGFIHVVDRLKDMIISGGENIYCAEIENALTWHPDIAEVTVVGRPDPTWGEVPVACIVPQDPAAPPDLASVRAYLKDRLASYKHPKHVHILPELPRTGVGKIHKPTLREVVVS
ncbi:AMP-binding protein [Brevibacterium samyangense]|uniref:Fatty-acid--CoA ligase FadD5 n=1 Tax=Brevibacterium samyangense TaxID=366888 RepID=A0ABN2TCH6_9MICO